MWKRPKNSTHEIWNTKQIQKQNNQIFKTLGLRHPCPVVISGDQMHKRVLFRSFDFKSLEFVSNFVLSISDLYYCTCTFAYFKRASWGRPLCGKSTYFASRQLRFAFFPREFTVRSSTITQILTATPPNRVWTPLFTLGQMGNLIRNSMRTKTSQNNLG